MTVLQEVKVVRPQYADSCCSDTCQMLVNWEVVKSREVYYTENSSDLHLYEINKCLFSFEKRIHFPVLLSLVDLRKESLQRFTSVLFLCWLALGGSEFAAKVLWRCVQQPVGVHQTQVSHVAAGGVQQLIEDHVRWLGLEKDGGGVDGHGLVGVQS